MANNISILILMAQIYLSYIIEIIDLNNHQ